MARNPHEATAQAGGKAGYSGGTHGAYGGNGNKGTTSTTGTKKKITTGDGVKNLSLVGSIFTGNIKGVIGNIASRFMPKPKTEKQKSESYTKKGFDILNPNEMRSATYKPPVPVGGGPGDRDGTPQITLNTQSLASTAIPETKSGWGFEAYAPGSTANTRLYGKKGKMIKANQGEFSQGKRFGPPPNKGPDPQGINAPLNSVDYFKDLL